MSTLAWIVASCLAGTVLSLALAAFVAFRLGTRWISTLVSYAVGAMLGAVFIDLLPHLFEIAKSPARAAGFILVGILVFFMLEKLLLWRHHHGDEEDSGHDERTGAHHAHGHDQGRTAWMVIFGDSFHNFTDGVIIAGAFLADLKVGVVTSLAIIAHEIPQEMGDFVVILHSGFGKAKALFWNAVSGLAAVAGGVAAYFALSAVSGWIPEILAFAAASMIYVAVADLIPGLHRRTGARDSLIQVIFIALGIGSIWLIHAVLFPEV
ncbi:MAG TPA: ZIP family metal transporter [Usitatibacter sp.]|nr:ZIP family metal transporter [Usitatibacter sp.]